MVPVLAFGLASVPAQAETGTGDKLFDSVSIYAGQGADHSLVHLPEKIVNGRLDWDPSYFTAVGVGRMRTTLGQSFNSLEGSALGSIKHGYELLFVQHRGLQSNGELGAAYMLRTPDLELGPVGVNFAAGSGLSYALGRPSYEDGPKGDPDRRYRLQLLALFELEWRVFGLENWSFVTRVHHRSGVFGVIAPRRVGSNFLAAGIRYQF